MKLRLAETWCLIAMFVPATFLVIGTGALISPGEITESDRRRLVGTWSNDINVGAETFREDGSGLLGNGLGNFPFHWRILRHRRDTFTVRIEYTGYSWGSDPNKIYGPAESLVVQPDHDLKLVFQSNDVFGTHGVLFYRQR